jgi:hypothetical protein
MRQLVLKPQNSTAFLRPGRVVKLQDTTDDEPPKVVRGGGIHALYTYVPKTCTCTAHAWPSPPEMEQLCYIRLVLHCSLGFASNM